ncbi:ethyl tert-butyl ether degradation protein EthD [Mycolicibacterium setense]|uniref:Ethyl tert-butyl ether degradation protein EthD n=1 Tax=Mycolicibacterium setense TaxID=431269 RepID=A0ABR4Z0K5_9MYCO|nr:nuclear transport factor 2 family protein [Mycolicibacterium setense]KHO27968.1 ethyl tert-butyl ether degradation protein EthD [Mycolicibacterium setense]
MPDSDRLRTLCDERDIERALNLFARAMDDRDWGTMAEILTDDVEGDFGTGRLVGSAAIIDMIRGYLDSCGPTQHLLGNVVVDVAGDTATSRAYIRDVHLNSAADPSMRFYTLGDYHDTWRRYEDGRWRITERVKANRAYVGPLEIFDN